MDGVAWRGQKVKAADEMYDDDYDYDDDDDEDHLMVRGNQRGRQPTTFCIHFNSFHSILCIFTSDCVGSTVYLCMHRQIKYVQVHDGKYKNTREYE